MNFFSDCCEKRSFKGVWQRRISFSLIAGDLFDFELEFNCTLAENFVSSMINSVSIVSRCSFRSILSFLADSEFQSTKLSFLT